MPANPVTVLVWRDAKNDPPPNPHDDVRGWRSDRGLGMTVSGWAVAENPDLWTHWCELPVFPAADALTTDDLERIREMCQWALCEDDPDDEQAIAAARLRRAIKETTHE